VIAAYLRRGLAAGLLAGFLAGAFAFGEPLQDRAAAHAHGAAPGHYGGMVELSRSTQKVGLFFATGLSGCFLGGSSVWPSPSSANAWARGATGRAASLAASFFTGVALLPFLKYPANPPGIGGRPP